MRSRAGTGPIAQRPGLSRPVACGSVRVARFPARIYRLLYLPEIPGNAALLIESKSHHQIRTLFTPFLECSIQRFLGGQVVGFAIPPVRFLQINARVSGAGWGE